jgi:hypothetical protein
LLAGFVGVDVAFATIGGAFRITRLDLRLTDAPGSGTVSAMVNTVAGGGGTALLSGTVADGTRHISVTGDILFSGTTTLYLRITSESGFAMGLSASVEISTPSSGAPATVFLSTLQNVKDSAGITGSTNDDAITRHLEGVSKSMQNWMGRNILSTVTTSERHYPVGLSTGMVLDIGPIMSIEEVRQAGVVLVSDTYRAEQDRILRRVSGEYRIKWPSNSEIEVDYTAGHAAVPADLVEACTQETVRGWLQTVKAGGAGTHVSSVSPETGNTNIFVTTGFMPQTISAMTPYRRLA